MVKSFSELFTDSIGAFRANVRTLLVGAFVLSLLIFTGQMLFQSKTVSLVERRFGSVEHFSDLADRMGRGDEGAVKEMMQSMGMEDIGGTSDDAVVQAMMFRMIRGVGPSLGLLVLASLILFVLGKTYFLVVAVEETEDPADAFIRACRVVFPLIGIHIWMFLRSFVWIPLVGPFIGLVIGPRLMLAPVVYLREGTGIVESVRISNERSRGYWWKIVGNGFLAGIAIGIVMFVAWIVLSIVLSMVPPVSAFAFVVVPQIALAFGTVFYAHLSGEILSHPLVPGKVMKAKKPAGKKRK